MVMNALDIAKKLLYKATNEDNGELISNLKLQKLLYYMQGYHLAVFDTPLFDDEIEAWMYGPVVRSVYEEYSKYGHQGIECNEIPVSLSDDEEELFNEVYDVYGQYSAIGLMKMTHDESPWKSVKEPGVGVIMPKEQIKAFFKTRII